MDRHWQTGPNVDELLKHWRFPGRGRVRVPFTERISPTFNLTLLLLQALDVAYGACHCRRLTELLHTIRHTTPVNRLFSTAQPSWDGLWFLHTDEVSQDGLVFTTAIAAVFLHQKLNWTELNDAITNALITRCSSNNYNNVILHSSKIPEHICRIRKSPTVL